MSRPAQKQPSPKATRAAMWDGEPPPVVAVPDPETDDMMDELLKGWTIVRIGPLTVR